jgi:hypothetical protein
LTKWIETSRVQEREAGRVDHRLDPPAEADVALARPEAVALRPHDAVAVVTGQVRLDQVRGDRPRLLVRAARGAEDPGQHLDRAVRVEPQFAPRSGLCCRHVSSLIRCGAGRAGPATLGESPDTAQSQRGAMRRPSGPPSRPSGEPVKARVRGG